MTRSIVRSAGLLVAVFMSLLSGPSVLDPATAATRPALSYAYDGHYPGAVLTCTTTERGPPMSCDPDDTYDAADRWSHGASARSHVTATSATYGYDDLTRFVQTARSSCTEGQVGGPEAGSVVVGRPGVAANAVDEVAQVGDTVLYQKLGSAGEHLKYGITKNPATRYTSKEMNGGSLNILARGSKQDMLALERSLHETLPIGPEEGQLFYIQKQIANGLRPPPYPW